MREARARLQEVRQPSEWDMIWHAFWRLNDERPHLVQGVGHPLGGIMLRSTPQRIPWSAVLRWCEVYGLNLDLAEHCIAEMDTIYLKEWGRKDVAGGQPRPGVQG